MESWRKCFKEGFAVQFSTEALQALKTALETDDKRLISGHTTYPRPPIMSARDVPVESACPIGFMVWNNVVTVGEVLDEFAKSCVRTDMILGESNACRYFLNFVDDTPRAEMRRLLLAEVTEIIEERMGEAYENTRADA